MFGRVAKRSVVVTRVGLEEAAGAMGQVRWMSSSRNSSSSNNKGRKAKTAKNEGLSKGGDSSLTGFASISDLVTAVDAEPKRKDSFEMVESPALFASEEVSQDSEPRFFDFDAEETHITVTLGPQVATLASLMPSDHPFSHSLEVSAFDSSSPIRFGDRILSNRDALYDHGANALPEMLVNGLLMYPTGVFPEFARQELVSQKEVDASAEAARAEAEQDSNALEAEAHVQSEIVTPAGRTVIAAVEEENSAEELQASSVLKKRRKKVRKHKLRKLRKRKRAERKRLGKL